MDKQTGTEEILQEDIVLDEEQTSETNKYIPWSSEKKRAVLMYFFLWIVLIPVGKKSMNVFEYAHFKQAIGWWALFFLVVMTNIVLLFIPILKWLSIFLILIVLGVLAFFIKQSLDGEYYVLKQESPLFVFQGLGEWVINLFDLELDVK